MFDTIGVNLPNCGPMKKILLLIVVAASVARADYVQPATFTVEPLPCELQCDLTCPAGVRVTATWSAPSFAVPGGRVSTAFLWEFQSSPDLVHWSHADYQVVELLNPRTLYIDVPYDGAPRLFFRLAHP